MELVFSWAPKLAKSVRVNIGFPVVRTDGRRSAVGVRSRDYKISGMGSYGAPPARAWSSAINKKCNLCLWEEFFIICKPEMSIRNHRNELTSICRHSKKCLSILVFSYVTIFVPKVMHTTIVYDFNQIVAAKYHNLATTGYFSEEMN